ncbi:MAG: YfhO family protein [Bacteroidetes bacterium]|nr:YfhO family protein [Bacteroidota bacterium]
MSKQANHKSTGSAPSNSNIYDTYIKGKEIYYLLGIISLVCYVVFSDFISLKKVYLFRDIGSDSLNIYFPWLAGTSDYLKNESSLGWSFSQGMGQNLFPLWIGDIFSNFLTYFDKSKIPYGLVFMEITKIFLAGFIFYKFLKEIKLSNFSNLLFSFLYAFSGFIILGGCWTVFSLEAVYAALILYGFERWLNHGKFLWLVTGITLMAFLQPFFLFMYTILLAAYAIVRYHDVHEKNNKQFFLFTAKTVGLATVAVFMSSYQLFADLLQYTESPRVGGEASLFARLQKQGMFDPADDVLRFTTVFRSFGSDMLGTGNNFKGWQNYLEAPLFYCGIFCLVAFPQFFSSLNKRQKYFYGVLTFVFCLPIIFPYFRYAFWAFSGDYFRTFSLVIIFFMVMFSARAISYIEQQGKLNKVVLVGTVLFLLFLLYTPAAQFKGAINTSLRSFATFLLFAYAALLFGLSQRTSIRHMSKVLLIVVCVVEVMYFSSITVNKRDVVTQQILNEKVGYNDYTVEAISYLKQTDKDFYRVNKDYSSGLAIHSSINDAKVQGFYGTPSYFSFNQKNYIKFLGDLNVIDVKDENSTRWAKGLGDRPILFSLASGKYWLSKRTDNAVQGMGFDSINKFGDVKVYKNKYALPFGFTYDKGIGEDEFKKLSPGQKDFCLLRACVIGNEDKTTFAGVRSFNVADTTAPVSFDNYLTYVNELKKENFKISKFSENNIIGDVNTADPKILFFSIPFDEGWKATLNGKEVKLYRLNCGLTGLLTEKGKNTVELTFVPRFKKIGTLVSLISLLVFAGLLALNYFRNKPKTNIQE